MMNSLREALEAIRQEAESLVRHLDFCDYDYESAYAKKNRLICQPSPPIRRHMARA